ncbi:EF-hand domain-containing protein [Hydrogenophaga sp. PAMC20947]|uniref:EF-hand domain-containing protein n=1 Tax=Hydrogenophaga sp. PAMC20947 TaxID=2565558 RepID=UPI00109E2A6C|nr:EF-hand domain-containing protein [Hydrogenophaga sp. PAMC20947]QCB47559.1 EF-hand domain-containing protein [Hydrogenophaga sp. PAMC20947]
MSINKTRKTLLEACGLLLFASLTFGLTNVAMAETKTQKSDAKSGKTIFAQADKNGDRRLSLEEAKTLPASSQPFDKMDTNRDGVISEEEFFAAN